MQIQDKLLPGNVMVTQNKIFNHDIKCLGIENFTEAKCHSESSEESQSPAKV